MRLQKLIKLKKKKKNLNLNEKGTCKEKKNKYSFNNVVSTKTMDTRMNEIKLTQVQLSLQHGGSELFFILEIVTVFDGIY